MLESFDFDELIQILEEIREGKRDTINHARTLYTICLKIKEIEKKLKQGKITEWISIKDRLPKVGEWVLIYTPVGEDELIEIAMLDILMGFINPSMGYGSFKKVTHWMPLPKYAGT